MRLFQALHPRGVTPSGGGGEPDAPVASAIVLTPASFTLRVGNLQRIVARCVDQYGNTIAFPDALSWSSDSTGVATVDSVGVVTGVAAGAASITVTSGSLSSSAAATVETAPVISGWSEDRFPHASHGLLAAVTDFRTPYIADPTQKAEELAFQATHADKIVSGSEPAGGYPDGMIHQPYMLTSFVAVCVHDGDRWRNTRNKSDWAWEQWCAANGKDPENGYLHYGSGQDTYDAAIVAIDASGQVTLQHDLVTHTGGAFRDGATVTISGVTPASFNGSWPISNVGVTGGDYDEDGEIRRAKTVFTIPHTGEVATGFGKAKCGTGDGTKTKRNRLIFDVPGFPPPRWLINHAHADRIAFERDRLQKLVDGTYPDVGYTPEGMYIDELAQNIWGRFMSQVTVEYPSGGGSQWLADFSALFAATQADWPNNPWMQQMGTASYSSTQTTQLIEDGSLSAHLEQMGNPHTRYEWVPGSPRFEWVRELLSKGAYLGFACPYTPLDKIDGGERAGNYADDPKPAGFRSSANVRMAVSVFVIPLMMQLKERPYTLCYSFWNGAWNPSDPLAGLNNRWLELTQVDLGLPIEDASRVVTGQTDTAGQAVTIASRRFERGLVLYRRVDADPNTCDYAATYAYLLPPSTGTDGKWCRVRSNGTLDSPVTVANLASDEGLIYLPAP